jgi:integrase
LAQVGAETTTQGAVILLKAIILYHTPLNFSSFEYQGIFAPFFQTKGVYYIMKKRKDGRYQKNIYIGRDENGKRKYKSVCGTSRKEVETLAAELKQKLGKGIDISSDDTYGCWKKRWLTVQRSLQTPQQYKTLERYLKHFAELEPYKINKLTIADFQEIVFDLAAKNPTTGKPTAKKSLKEFIATASRVFEYAIENRAIDFNPLKYVKISKNAAKKKERRALSPEEQKLIINTPHRGRLPAMIMLLAGLRRGECLGLQWADIDLKRNKINVHQTLVLDGNNSYIKAGAKTEAGVRKVDIPTVLSDYLKSLAPHSPFDYVVTTTKGKLMTNSAWRRLWESYINCLNLEAFNSQQGKIVGIAPRSKYCPDGIPQVIEPFTAHCLRHTHATNLFYSGYDILYIQHQLGHTKPETTLNIYTHLMQDDTEAPAKKLDDFLNRKIS